MKQEPLGRVDPSKMGVTERTVATLRAKASMAVSSSSRRLVSLLILALVYVLAWGPLLLTLDGIWWDDWTLTVGSSSSISEMFAQIGQPWFGWLHLVLQPVAPVGHHLLSFALFLVVGFLLWGILGSFHGLGRWEQLFVAVIFLVLPLNAARNTMIVLPYTMSLALFYLAWYLLTRARQPSLTVLVMSGVLFFVSFSLNSLLVFFVVPMVHFWWMRHTDCGQTPWQFAKTYWPLLLLPLAYYVGKGVLYPPYGSQEGYNALTQRGLLIGLFLLVLTGLPFAMMFYERARLSAVSRSVWLIGFGGASLVSLAIFPYVSVGHTPPFFEWQTRDQILMPLGLAVILLAAVRLVSHCLGTTFAAVFAVLAVAISVVLSQRIGLEYWVDWRKQQALIEAMRDDESLRAAQLVVFRDLTTDDNVFGSPYRFYAWNGLMTKAFGESTRFGINLSDVSRYVNGDLRYYYGTGGTLDYGASGFVEPSEATIVEVRREPTGQYSFKSSVVATSELP